MNRRTVIENLMGFVGLAGTSAVASTKNDKFWVGYDVPPETKTPKRVWKCKASYVIDLDQFSAWAIVDVEGQYRQLIAVGLDERWLVWYDDSDRHSNLLGTPAGEAFVGNLLYNSWDLRVKLVDSNGCKVMIDHIEEDRRDVPNLLKHVPCSWIVIIPDGKELDGPYDGYSEMKAGQWSGRK